MDRPDPMRVFLPDSARDSDGVTTTLSPEYCCINPIPRDALRAPLSRGHGPFSAILRAPRQS